jgi:pimeloyl-ACP methyl ester carboxylesterase
MLPLGQIAHNRGPWNRITLRVSEGTIPFYFKGDTLRTWYKVFGHISLRNGPRPLVVLHGGPGLSHDYLIPISDIASFPEHRAIIFYDQIGNGQSTHLPHKDQAFWKIDLFIDELVNLLSYFKIIGDFKPFVGRHPRGRIHHLPSALKP